MQEIIDEIERAAIRCKVAATELKGPFLNAVQDEEPLTALTAIIASISENGIVPTRAESVSQRAQQAIDAFENVRLRIVPLLESILQAKKYTALRAKFSAIHNALQSAKAMSLDLDAKVLEDAKSMAVTSPEMCIFKYRGWAFMDAWAQVSYALMLAMISLPMLSDDLVYVAMYLRGKNAQAYKAQASNATKGKDVVSANITNNFSGNTNIGAFGQGDGAVVTGNISTNTSTALTQENHKRAITKAKNALNADQDALERIDERLYEALGQFLHMARQIQVDQASMADAQAKMKATFDEVWADWKAKGMKESALPQGLEVIKELAGNEVMAEVLKKLLGL